MLRNCHSCHKPGFVLRKLSLLTTTTPSMTLKLDTTFISEDDVVERVAAMIPGKFQSFLLVDVTYELAISAPPKRPAQRRPASKNGPKIQVVPQASKEDMQLTGSGFIVTTHLFFNYPLNIISYNRPSTTASLP